MRRINAVMAGFAAIVTLGTAANAGQANSEKLKFHVATDKKAYALNTTIKMTFTIKNTGAKPILLTFTSGQRYDITISDGKKTVWKWSQGRMFMQSLSDETIKAGKTLTYTEVYKPGTPTMPALPLGTYTVSASPMPTDKAVPLIKTTFKIVAAK